MGSIASRPTDSGTSHPGYVLLEEPQHFDQTKSTASNCGDLTDSEGGDASELEGVEAQLNGYI